MGHRRVDCLIVAAPSGQVKQGMVKKKLAARVAQLRFQPVFRQRRRVVALRIHWHAIRFRSIYRANRSDSFRRRRQLHAPGLSVQSQGLPDPGKLHQHPLPAPNQPALREQLRSKRRVLQCVSVWCPQQGRTAFRFTLLAFAFYFFRVFFFLALERVQVVFQVIEKTHLFSMKEGPKPSLWLVSGDKHCHIARD